MEARGASMKRSDDLAELIFVVGMVVAAVAIAVGGSIAAVLSVLADCS